METSTQNNIPTAAMNDTTEEAKDIGLQEKDNCDNVPDSQPETLVLAESEANKNIENSPDSDHGALSAPETASNIVDDALDLDESDFVTTEEVNEVYDNIMNVCSTAAQAIKQTIVQVLNSRDEHSSVEQKDTSSDLEASLKEKIADFESAVSSCCPIDKVECPNDNAEVPGNTVESNEEKDKNIKKSPEVEPEVTTANASQVPNVQLDKQPENRENVTEKNEPVSIQDKPRITLEEENYLRRQQKSYVNKKKGEKTVDQILKSLSSCSSSEEKLQVLSKKHVEALEELRSIEPRLKLFERQVISLGREKEQLQADHNRMILAKSRLESLCRELQRQNKAVKEESLIRIREEEEKRKEVANKFQATLNDISALMQENSKKNITLREENAELAKKLKALVDHYEMWEKHMEKVVQQKDLETQLAKAKHAKTNLVLKQETEKFLREKQTLLENMSELQKKCTMLASNELQLRTELGDYTSKYEEFQTVLNKSSQVFANFKTDMETTSKKIKKLEKETNVYKQKWESSNNALLNMISDKQKQDKELLNAQQRVLTLEKLCRALQAERNELQNQVNVLSTAAQVQACEKDVPLPVAEAIE